MRIAESYYDQVPILRSFLLKPCERLIALPSLAIISISLCDSKSDVDLNVSPWEVFQIL